MFCQETVDPWRSTIMAHLPHLSKTQATGLALWSLGLVLARSCALTAVSALLAEGLQQKENTVRQRLREWCYEAQAKRGKKRQEAPRVGVDAAAVESRRASRLDGDRVGRPGLVCPVVIWADRARGLASVLTDQHRRDISARGLAALPSPEQLGARGGHAVERSRDGPFKGRGRQLECTLLARWDAGHQDPWLILTDLPPEASDAGWYGLRAWMEPGFKVTKRAGWQWQRTRMSDPARASRLWLAVAVATLWLLSVGGDADADVPVGTFEAVTALCPPKRRSRRQTRLRLVSVFRRGWIRLLVALIRHEPLPEGLCAGGVAPCTRGQRGGRHQGGRSATQGRLTDGARRTSGNSGGGQKCLWNLHLRETCP